MLRANRCSWRPCSATLRGTDGSIVSAAFDEGFREVAVISAWPGCYLPPDPTPSTCDCGISSLRMRQIVTDRSGCLRVLRGTVVFNIYSIVTELYFYLYRITGVPAVSSFYRMAACTGKAEPGPNLKKSKSQESLQAGPKNAEPGPNLKKDQARLYPSIADAGLKFY